MCKGLRLSAGELARLKEHVAQPSSLRRVGASRWLEALADKVSDNTWFMLRGDQQAILTHRGTRPGSSWADVLFGMIIARVLDERDSLEFTDQAAPISRPRIPWDGQKTLQPCPSSAQPIELGDVVWADDVATMRVCDNPRKLAASLALSSGSLCDACANFGFRLSFGPNKTAAIMQPSGPGTRAAARELFGPDGHKGAVQALREDSPPIRVPLVGSYRHLGSLQTPKGALTQELRYRAAQAWAKFSEGRRKVYKAKGISVRRKAFLLRSSVLPKLLYGAVSWPCLRLHELRTLGGTLWSLYRAICGIPGTDDQHLHSCTILAITGLPSVLHCQRLLYLKLLLKSGPDELWALLRSDQAYLDAMSSALRWLHSWTHETCHLPNPDWHWDEWSDFIRHSPGRFKGLLLRAQALESCRQQVLGSLDGLYRSLKALAPGGDSAAVPLGGCPEACLPCKRLFSSRVAWAGHAARIHGYRSKAHILARSRVCLACGKQYATTGRLRRHLVTATSCVQSWGVFTPLIPDDGEGADGHVQRPPIAVPGSFGDPNNFASDVPPDVSSGLLHALNSLPECDESVVWDTVVEHIEPLQVLRETVQYWSTAASDSPWVQQVAENVLLLLDPELVGEPDSAQQGKVRKHAFALGHSPDWCPLPSFCLPTSSVGPCFDLADPPPVALDPHSATSVQLRLGQAYSTWLEQACAVLAKGLAIAQAQHSSFQVRCTNLETALGPARAWLQSAGFVFWQGGVRSSDFVSPEFEC